MNILLSLFIMIRITLRNVYYIDTCFALHNIHVRKQSNRVWPPQRMCLCVWRRLSQLCVETLWVVEKEKKIRKSWHVASLWLSIFCAICGSIKLFVSLICFYILFSQFTAFRMKRRIQTVYVSQNWKWTNLRRNMWLYFNRIEPW